MIQKAGFFSVIADEAANDEQLSVCVHFVDGGLPHEKFLAFHECQSGVTDDAIVLSNLAVWQLQQWLGNQKVLLLVSFRSTLKLCTHIALLID